MTIDAHAHVWSLARGDYGWLTPELGVLHRDHGIDELTGEMARVGVKACVLVHARPPKRDICWRWPIPSRAWRVWSAGSIRAPPSR